MLLASTLRCRRLCSTSLEGPALRALHMQKQMLQARACGRRLIWNGTSCPTPRPGPILTRTNRRVFSRGNGPRLQTRGSASIPKADSSSLPSAYAMGAGAASGILASLTGLGGGVVLIPVLSHFTSLSQHAINGTSLFAVTLTSCVAATTYLVKGIVDVPVALIMSTFSVLTTGLGAKWSTRISDRGLRKFMGFVLLGIAPLIAMRESRPRKRYSRADATDTVGEPGSPSIAELWNDFVANVKLTKLPGPIRSTLDKLGLDEETSPTTVALVQGTVKYYEFALLGMFSGFASGLLGLGGGLIMTSYMALFTDFDQLRAVGTSLAAIAPIGLSASYFHSRHGHVQVSTGAKIALASVTGALVTANYFAVDVPEERLRQVFSGMLLVGATSMLRKAMRA